MKASLGKIANVSLCMDFYELTMAQCYYYSEHRDSIVTFDYFYRRNPDQGGYAVFAGLEEFVGFLKHFCFQEDDIQYLKSMDVFTDEFLNYLRQFRFHGDIYSVLEGTPIFPNEPLVQVKANLIEAQIIETALLLIMNHQSLIATKARRIVKAAQGRSVLEFGARRAHNFDAAIYGARAAAIGGVHASATVSAGKYFQIPVLGTMAHSFVQSFSNEYEAFLTYAKMYPEQCCFLLDTYDTLKSGLPNAIKVAKTYLEPNGYQLQAVRIDSGDIAYLSKQIRKILDEHQLKTTKIVVSNALDEYLIRSLIQQGAKVDSFGVGENLICCKSSPVFGGVYKLSSIANNDVFVPKIKISENVEKVTNPGYKKLFRIYQKDTHQAIGDYMMLYDEEMNETKDLTMYHPMNSWKKKTIKKGTYYAKELLHPIFLSGELVYDLPTLEEIQSYSKQEFQCIWDEVQRLDYPQDYYVDISKKLLDLKWNMLEVKEDE